MTRIAIIEDETVDSNNMKRLIEESMTAEVYQAFNKADAEALLSKEKFDLVIMDIELGTGSKNRYAGLGLLSDIRASWPTIVVSGVGEENLRGLSLTLHAYDFIGKPVDEIDFVSTVERALAWSRTDAGKDPSVSGALPDGLTLDAQRKNSYLWKGQRVPLSITQLSIVQCLVEQPGKVVETKRLLRNLKSAGSPKAVTTHMSNIRTIFRIVDPAFDRIDTEPGRGYYWKTTP